VIVFGLSVDLDEVFVTFQVKLNSIQTFSKSNVLVALSLYCFIYFLCTAFSVPGMFLLTVLGSAVFGVYLAVFLTAVSGSLGSSACFLVFRNLFGNNIKHHFRTQFKKIDQEIDAHGLGYLICMRLIPFLPYYVINFASAITSISIRRFFIATFVGMLPIHICFAFVGQEFENAHRIEDLFNPNLVILCLLLSLISYASVRYRRSKLLGKEKTE
jgi:uncharacterized membrane protein YdjX (TVP38/TMEM64 family)